MRRLIATIAAAAAAALLAGPAAAAENLNLYFGDICKSFRELNTELGASASPGSPIAGTMQKELSLSAAHYTEPSGRFSSSLLPELQPYLLTRRGAIGSEYPPSSPLPLEPRRQQLVAGLAVGQPAPVRMRSVGG